MFSFEETETLWKASSWPQARQKSEFISYYYFLGKILFLTVIICIAIVVPHLHLGLDDDAFFY